MNDYIVDVTCLLAPTKTATEIKAILKVFLQMLEIDPVTIDLDCTDVEDYIRSITEDMSIREQLLYRFQVRDVEIWS